MNSDYSITGMQLWQAVHQRYGIFSMDRTANELGLIKGE
jgi:hypothetical protein